MSRGFILIGVWVAVLLLVTPSVRANPTYLNVTARGDTPLAVCLGADLMISDGVKSSDFIPIGYAFSVGLSGGTGGGEVRLGYGCISPGSSGTVLAGAVALVRTWNDPWNADENDTYIGPELFFQSVGRVGVGVLFRIDEPSSRVIPRLSLGVGYLTRP
jgi:hypothetical protein